MPGAGFPGAGVEGVAGAPFAVGLLCVVGCAPVGLGGAGAEVVGGPVGPEARGGVGLSGCGWAAGEACGGIDGVAGMGERTDSMPRGDATGTRGAGGGAVGVGRDVSGTARPALLACAAGSVGVCVGVCACAVTGGFVCSGGGG